MEKKHIVWVFVAGTVLSSCATPVVTLDAGADSVKIVEYLNSDERAKLKDLKLLKCELGMNARSPDANVTACENQFRNEAKKLGGTVVLVEPEKRRVGEIAGCNNCVHFQGIVFVKK